MTFYVCGADALVRIDLVDLLQETHVGAEVIEASHPAGLPRPSEPIEGGIAILYGETETFSASPEVSALESAGVSVVLIATDLDASDGGIRNWIVLPLPFTDADFNTSIDMAISSSATGRRTHRNA